MRTTAIALMAAGSVSASAPAQAEVRASPVCPGDAAPIPQELRSWASRATLASATHGAGPAIEIGRAYDVALHPDGELKLRNLPGPIEDRVGRGGTMNFSVRSAGTYHVALSSGVWVDVVREGIALESVGHGHGPACSGIAKIVDFALSPGRYTLTLDGSETDRVSVLVAWAPGPASTR